MHRLTIYTALYLAILFLTVSIWSSDIRHAEGKALALLVLLGTFSLKLAIDDYVHFQRLDGATVKTVNSLVMSLVVYLLLAASIACASTRHTVAAELLIAAVMLAGIVWLVITWRSQSETEPKDWVRRIGWLVVNFIIGTVLVVDAAFSSQYCADFSLLLIYGLTAVVVVDAIAFRTFRRLAELDRPDQPASPPCDPPPCQVLLEEIRDLLKK
ncbi:MAG TPA: hypothetical protein VHE13_04225 [Opitutus sp.]|nr:hypothetical protein [Opitutus sp.]